MCGIAGIFGFERDVEPQRVLPMLFAMGHRGPDGAGLFAETRVALGHQRLALAGLGPMGTQPLLFARERYVLLVNGQVHNCRELLDKEVALGFVPSSTSDCEVLLPLLARSGPDALARVQGPFALALLDRSQGSLLLARDRAGQRPLFFRSTQNELTFASELRALSKDGHGADIDPLAVAALLRAGYSPGRRTLLRRVESLEPGTSLRIAKDGTRTSSVFASLTRAGREQRVGTEALDRELNGELATAVRRRVEGERRTGVLLSGGLDSLTVLHHALAVSPSVPAFTLGFDDPQFDETSAATASARALRAHHRVVRFERPPEDVLVDLIAKTGEPLCDSSWLALSEVCRQVKSEVTVLLTGDGGDELLIGYDRHRFCDLAARWSFGLAALGHLPAFGSSRMRRAIASLKGRDTKHRLAELVGLLPSSSWRSLLREPFASMADPLYLALYDIPTDSTLLPSEEAALLDLRTYLRGDLLVKSDRAAMSHGMEIWAPFVDPSVLAAGLRFHRDQLVDGRHGKMPLRRLLKGKVDAALLKRRKKGFGVPLATWLRGSYGEFARETLARTPEPFEGVLIEGTASRLLSRVHHEPHLAPVIHALVVIAVFHETIVRGAITNA